MASAKRKRNDDDSDDATPRKLRARDTDDIDEAIPEVHTPCKRGKGQPAAEAGTPRSILKKTGLINGINGTTPKSNRRLLFATPSKADYHDESPAESPSIVRNADRSARRKSNRKLLDRAINGVESDEDALEEEQALAEQILSDDEPQGEVTTVEQQAPPVPDTPTKRKRGRPKGSGKKARMLKERSPTPTELPSHEEYFWQNRPGGNKTSNNILPSQSLLNHDEYFEAMQSHQDRHEPEKAFLLELHSRAFDQWIFELQQGFNLCLYGYGSKRPITEKFTAHLYHHLLDQKSGEGSKQVPKIVVINGYTSGITLKDVLTTVASTVVTAHTKLPNQLTSLLAYTLDYLSQNSPPQPIPIIINSIDSPYLRKGAVPAMLAALAAHPSINLVCTADTPNFPLLWDVGLRAQYKFLFHDATTFAPYDAEIDVVETVNELLGRSGRRIGGRDGVGFVLRSLPENARSLFRILVTEQLALLYMEGEGMEGDDVPATPRNKKIVQTQNVSVSARGVEYRVLYHKAVEEFVCSSEVGFRTLLKEFHDHQMIESRKDAMGTERLWVPFRLEELEGLVEDLSVDTL